MNNDYYFACHLNSDVVGRAADVASQQKVGVLPQWRFGFGDFDSDYFAAIGTRISL